MSDPLNPATLDETELMEGTVTSVSVDTVGDPTLKLWITDDVTGDLHQMNASLLTNAVARLGMLQVLKDAVAGARPVTLRWTADDNGVEYFHLVRMH